MKYFFEMIDQVKRQDVISAMSIDEKRHDFPVSDFFKLLERCQPFVFSEPQLTREQRSLIYEKGLKNDLRGIRVEMDAPFPVWSAEIMGGKIAGSTIKKDLPEPDLNDYDVLCFMAVEIAPKKFSYYVYCEIRVHNSQTHRAVVWTTSMDAIAESLVSRIYTEKTGTESGTIKLTIGSGKHKKRIKINRVIHVRSASTVPTEDSPGIKIDWSHRWRVMGHWRVLEPGKLGKDRQGNYTQTGHTWVIEHIKGPENRPLIDNKLRIIGATKNVENTKNG